ncbi:MAG: glycosyltransferase family 4 protein [Deltaproteobacteria bacterium]|nr:glycosyltransferase family 4 protein [Deltaproteobacteria bacterium]
MATPVWSGPVEPTVRLADALAIRGHTIHFACDGLRAGDLPLRLAHRRVLADLKLSVKSPPWQVLGDRSRIKAYVAETPIDIVHCHFGHDHTLALSAGLEAPIVRSIHRESSLDFGPLRRWFYRRTAAFTTASDAHAALLRDRYGRSSIRLPGIVDTTMFRPSQNDEERKSARALFSLEPDDVAVGYVARMNEGRAHQLLIDAMETIRKSLPTARLVLVGRGERESFLRNYASTRALGNVVIFGGYRTDDLPLAYRAFDLFVLPREGNDGTCRALLEAMATGLPCVAARRASLADTIVDGECGVLFREGDASDCARAILDAYNLRSALCSAARHRAKTQFRLEDRALELEDFYVAVANGNLPP